MSSEEQLLIHMQNTYGIKKFEITFSVQVNLAVILSDEKRIAANGENLTAAALLILTNLDSLKSSIKK